MTSSPADSARSWNTYSGNRHNYRIRYPPDWVIHEERPEMVSLKSPDSLIQLSLTFWQMDHSRMQEIFRGPARSNLYLIREFTIRLGNQDTAAFEFRDTIVRASETRVLSPAPGGCYEVRWRRPEGSESPELNATVQTILSTFELDSGK
jgi:hypothetical protein